MNEYCSEPPINSGKHELHVLPGCKLHSQLHGPHINATVNLFTVALGFLLFPRNLLQTYV